MRVDVAEIELAGEEEDDGADGGEVAIAARFALGRLKQAVDSFEEAVGLACMGPGNDAPSRLLTMLTTPPSQVLCPAQFQPIS